MSQQTITIEGPAPAIRCKICKQVISRFQLPTIGETPGAKAQKAVFQCTEHLQLLHPQHNLLADALAANLKGSTILSNFTLSDELAEAADMLRWSLHTQTARVQISDADAEQIASVFVGSGPGAFWLKDKPAMQNAIKKLIIDVRNRTEERGKYRPTDTAPRPATAS